MRVPRFIFFIFVIAYAVLALVVLTTDRLAKGWPGIVIYGIGCALVFLAFARKRMIAGRESQRTAEHVQDEQAGTPSRADSVERVEKIREKIRMRKSDGRNGRA